MLINIPIKTQIIIFTIYRTIFNTGLRMIYPYLPVFARGLNVDVKSISLVVSASLVTSIIGVFMAPLVDRFGRKLGMNIGLLIFILGTGAVYFFPTYTAFFAGLLLAYLGANIFTPSLLAYIGDRINFSQRGTSVALTEMSWSLSFIIFVPMAGILIQEFNWAFPFLASCLMASLCFIFLQMFLPNQKSNPTLSNFKLKDIGKAITHKPALAILLSGLMLIFGIGMINLMFGVWLEDSYNVKVAALGTASIVIGIAELSGASLSAMFSDLFGKKRSINTSLILDFIVIMLFPLLVRTYTGALVWLFLFYIFAEYAIVSILALSTEVVPWARTTFIALFTAALTLGMGLGTYIAPYIYSFSFRVLSLVCGGLLIIALFALAKTNIKKNRKSYINFVP